MQQVLATWGTFYAAHLRPFYENHLKPMDNLQSELHHIGWSLQTAAEHPDAPEGWTGGPHKAQQPDWRGSVIDLAVKAVRKRNTGVLDGFTEQASYLPAGSDLVPVLKAVGRHGANAVHGNRMSLRRTKDILSSTDLTDTHAADVTRLLLEATAGKDVALLKQIEKEMRRRPNDPRAALLAYGAEVAATTHLQLFVKGDPLRPGTVEATRRAARRSPVAGVPAPRAAAR